MTAGSSHYDTVLCNSSRLLHSTVKKENGRLLTRIRGADHSQLPAGHQVMEFWVDLGKWWLMLDRDFHKRKSHGYSWTLLRKGSCITHSPFSHMSHSRHSVWPQTFHSSCPRLFPDLLCSGSCICHILFEPTQTTFHSSHSIPIPGLCYAKGLA